MFDHSVESEGLGRAEQAMAKERGMGQSPDGLGQPAMGAYMVPEPGEQPTAQNRPQYAPRHMSSMGAGYDQDPYNSGDPYGPAMAAAPPGMAGELQFIEPEDTSQGAAVRSAGFTLLFLAISTGIGYAWKGGQGAASGLLLSAAASNGYRAQKWFDSGDPSEKHEAMVSALFAAAEFFGGGYLAYQAMKKDE